MGTRAIFESLSAGEIVENLLDRENNHGVAIIDSCGRQRGHNVLVAGIDPVETLRLDGDATDVLRAADDCFRRGLAAVFTVSYDFGLKLEPRLAYRYRGDRREPDIYMALYDSLIVHDYASGKTAITGTGADVAGGRKKERSATNSDRDDITLAARSNFSREQYVEAVGTIKELIRRGETYQVNLTQKISLDLPPNMKAAEIFRRLRNQNPVPYAAFIERGDSAVVSGSPERFFRTANGRIETSPIKGTRPRGATTAEDVLMRGELLASEKDRAENTMIVDLLRNDLGRICYFGSVNVEKLFEVEEYPTLFHLVSSVSGELRDGIEFSDIVKAIFPCGSITGAPKLRTMEIIDEIESVPRGLSMGAVGYFIPEAGFDLQPGFNASVAIRTMVVRGSSAEFNVGGGVVIDSDPEDEYRESLVKAKALLEALGSDLNSA